MLGYLAANDHIPLNEQVRSLDIVISHLHKDHFKNLTSDFLDTLIEETKVSLRSIWAPPVDVFLAAGDNTQIFDRYGNVRPLHEINSDISEFFARLNEFSSIADPDMQANVISADDLAGGFPADEITAKYNLRDFDNIGVNRTLYDIFSNSDLEVNFGRYGKKITIRNLLQQLDIDADVGLKEAATALNSLSEDCTLLEVLEEKWPVIVSPIDLRLSDVANAIRKIGDNERIEQIYRRDDVLIDRTEEDKILETDEDIVRHLIIFESILTSDSDFLADHPPKDATLDQLKAFGETTEDQIKRLRGSTIKNRMVLHDIYTYDESPPPEKQNQTLRREI